MKAAAHRCVCVQSVSLKSKLEKEQFAVWGQQVAVWTLEARCGSIKACPRSDSFILWPMKPAERNHDNEVRQCSFWLSNFRSDFTFVQNETLLNNWWITTKLITAIQTNTEDESLDFSSIINRPSYSASALHSGSYPKSNVPVRLLRLYERWLHCRGLSCLHLPK